MSNKITPSLESITIRAKYKVPAMDFGNIADYLKVTLRYEWSEFRRIGNSVEFIALGIADKWEEVRDKRRKGTPLSLCVTAIEHNTNGILLDVECRPAL